MTSVPPGWAATKLRDVVRLRTGPFGSSLHQSDYVDDGIPIVNPMHISDGCIKATSKHRVSEETAARLHEFQLVVGDIVLGRRGEMGRCAVVRDKESGWLCGTGSLVVKAHEGVSPEFLQQLLSSDAVIKHLTNKSVGSTMVNLNQQILLDLDLVIPPTTEQTRIVEKLEELLSDLDAGVTELKVAQRKLAQYRQSLLKAAVEGALTADWRAARHSYDYPPRSSSPRKRGSTGLAYPGVMDSRFRGNDGQSETGADLLQRILTERRTRWETRQLAKFAEQGKTPPKDWQARYPEPVVPDTTDLPVLPDSWAWASIEQVASDERHGLSIGPFGSNLKVSDYRESGVPLVFVRNIRSATYDGDKTKYVTPEKAASLHAHAIQGGDVLITKMGEPPGDADVYPDWLPPAIITADCIKVRCQQGLIHPSFLAASINSSTGRRQIGPITQGVAQKKVSLGRFISIAVPVPPLREQTEIVDLLTQAIEDADAQSLAIEASLKQSSAQRKNILKAAFAGQLVPQDPNDEPASVLLERIRTARVNRADKTKSVAKRGLRA